jgi:hypothetical protein
MMLAAITVPRLHQLNPTSAVKTRAISTPARTLTTR